MADAKPGFGRGVLLPTVLAAGAFGLAALFLGTFLDDRQALATGFIAAWVAFAVGRALGHHDRPRGYGLVLRHVLTGVSFGFAGFAFLNGLFVEGPGWPWTPRLAVLMGFGFGLYRSHVALLRQARDDEAHAPRWLGVFHPKDLQALGVLMSGYALVGATAFLVFRAFSPLIPGAGRLLAIGIAVYALQGARLLLRFASEERATRGQGVVAWLKANALQNAIVVLVLVAYAAFRHQLAASLPFFALLEFGLGVAVFAFVLARLRARFRKDGTPLATASTARDHQRVVAELREAEYDEIARPVTRFVESGQGAAEYADALRAAARLDEAAAERVLSPLRAHREPPRPPPLDLAWGLAAGAAMTLGLAVAAFALARGLFEAEIPFALQLALVFVAFGTYAQQDVARAHFRPLPSVAIAAGGVALLFLAFLLFAAQVGALADVPKLVWGIAAGVALVMLAIPALAAWRLERRLRAGQVVDARRLAPALEMQNELQKARKRAATMTLTALALLLPVPWLAGWLAERGVIPPGFPEFLAKVLAVAMWAVAGLGGAALVRFYGLTRAKPRLVARERERRARRLALHKTLMQSIERT